MDIAQPQLPVLNPQLSQLKAFIILLAMLLAAGAAVLLKPTQRMAEQHAQIDLEILIPKQFGIWKIDDGAIQLQVSPDVEANLSRIYSQTVSRTYVSAQGTRVMLSVAYGNHQNKSMQVHLPEVCYPAQGFQIKNRVKSLLELPGGILPVMRLEAEQGLRHEPITYWIRVGDTVARGAFEQKIAKIRFGLTGKVPDGLLFRVSTIGTDTAAEFLLQDSFINDLMAELPSSSKMVLLGSMPGE